MTDSFQVSKKSEGTKPFRGWEYARHGDYHRNVDPNWSYTPTYLQKMRFVNNWVEKHGRGMRILDAGCGEGVLVEQLLQRGYSIEGLDLNYESAVVCHGSVLNMPYDDQQFDIVLLLDVFEHLAFQDQSVALREIRRVLKDRGWLLASVPNLAHLNSRVRLLLRGMLDRSDIEINHPGERPMKENVGLFEDAGFTMVEKSGLTLTVPWLYRRLICRKPAQYLWLHDWLQHFAVPSLSMINMFICKKS